MQNSLNLKRDSLIASLDALGGELLAGSGFEVEDPEPGFSSTESGGEE